MNDEFQVRAIRVTLSLRLRSLVSNMLVVSLFVYVQIVLENLGKSGTILNGVAVTVPTVVPPESVFTVCDRSFRVEYGTSVCA